ncbi:MAG: hypothetical protein BroJett018_34290 [Chloroflexota bacterium]|nr:hypothetical protein [Chloroflexota bacterium]NOG64061.1 hypothetical protein [Chloroflexota bacterium]GIK65635.1 MAG: hypothetical protein BroJett018_34290 [Chloroflexota bacterium]
MTPYTEEEKRRILLELRYFYTEAELCQKWNLTRYRVKQWKKATNYAYLIGTLREMVIVALRNGASSIAAIIGYVDYLNHAVYTEAEIEPILHGLREEGIAQEQAGVWSYNRAYSKDDTSFIF